MAERLPVVTAAFREIKERELPQMRQLRDRFIDDIAEEDAEVEAVLPLLRGTGPWQWGTISKLFLCTENCAMSTASSCLSAPQVRTFPGGRVGVCV